jgi:hypothetical protein
MSPREGVRLALRVAGIALACAVLALFLATVWPTPYRYDHMTYEGETVIVRIDRLSGEAEMLLPDEGWVPLLRDEDMTGEAPDQV